MNERKRKNQQCYKSRIYSPKMMHPWALWNGSLTLEMNIIFESSISEFQNQAKVKNKKFGQFIQFE